MTPNDVKQLLLDAGFPAETIMMPLAQCAFESGSLTFDSDVAQQNNNLTGIIYLNEPFQHNCTQGIAKPSNEQAGFYANFATLADWSKDFHRIVHAQFCIANGWSEDWNTEGRPIDATDLPTYVHRLKLNKYFEGNEMDYLNGLKRCTAELDDWFAENPSV